MMFRELEPVQMDGDFVIVVDDAGMHSAVNLSKVVALINVKEQHPATDAPVMRGSTSGASYQERQIEHQLGTLTQRFSTMNMLAEVARTPMQKAAAAVEQVNIFSQYFVFNLYIYLF